ncbi:MAG TPA: methyltransferase domain-containing protein, partial [Chromatiales bacterium]|nr:methyltransferase domain-containing protein [Chromatiales bacterium]
REEVQRYYGETLQSTADLKTTACCTQDDVPAYVRDILGLIHDEVLARYYGCGLVLPEALDGMHILDLGCGAGRDCYVLSKLVGEQGRIVGVDMTPEQLEVARRYRDHHAAAFGYVQSNVEFVEGDIEHLDETGLPDGSFDLIVSNCVINLATDKQAVLNEAWQLLRDGGEMYFSDIYADRRIPDELRSDPVLYGECLSGALYWKDFIQLARVAGFADPRVVEARPVTVEDAGLAAKLGDIRFYSVTYRLFRLEGLDPGSEDYGQSVRYLGNIPHHAQRLRFDRYQVFETGKPARVSANTFRMLADSRFRPFFEFVAGQGVHLGPFAQQAAWESQSVAQVRACC